MQEIVKMQEQAVIYIYVGEAMERKGCEDPVRVTEFWYQHKGTSYSVGC